MAASIRASRGSVRSFVTTMASNTRASRRGVRVVFRFVSANLLFDFLASELCVPREASGLVVVAKQIVCESIDVVANALREILQIQLDLQLKYTVERTTYVQALEAALHLLCGILA